MNAAAFNLGLIVIGSTLVGIHLGSVLVTAGLILIGFATMPYPPKRG